MVLLQSGVWFTGLFNIFKFNNVHFLAELLLKFDFLAENYSENLQKLPNWGSRHGYVDRQLKLQSHWTCIWTHLTSSIKYQGIRTRSFTMDFNFRPFHWISYTSFFTPWYSHTLTWQALTSIFGNSLGSATPASSHPDVLLFSHPDALL